MRTGDLARIDEKGLLFFVGRKKDMIRRSGENISAAEVEEVIGLHPMVKIVACTAVPDELRGEEVMAYVVLQEGATAETAPPLHLIRLVRRAVGLFQGAPVLDLPRRSAADAVRARAQGDLEGRGR